MKNKQNSKNNTSMKPRQVAGTYPGWKVQIHGDSVESSPGWNVKIDNSQKAAVKPTSF